jgi:hypothetical protein
VAADAPGGVDRVRHCVEDDDGELIRHEAGEGLVLRTGRREVIGSTGQNVLNGAQVVRMVADQEDADRVRGAEVLRRRDGVAHSLSKRPPETPTRTRTGRHESRPRTGESAGA